MVDQKTIPLAAHIKDRETWAEEKKNLKKELSELKDRVVQFEQGSILNLKSEDKEEMTVKEKLIAFSEQIKQKDSQIRKMEESLKEREESIKAQENEYKSRERKGKLEESAKKYGIDATQLVEAVEAGENEAEVILRLKEKTSPNIADRTQPGAAPLFTKKPSEMTADELKVEEDRLRKMAWERGRV